MTRFIVKPVVEHKEMLIIHQNALCAVLYSPICNKNAIKRQKKSPIICQFQKRSYLCTRFRKQANPTEHVRRAGNEGSERTLKHWNKVFIKRKQERQGSELEKVQRQVKRKRQYISYQSRKTEIRNPNKKSIRDKKKDGYLEP